MEQQKDDLPKTSGKGTNSWVDFTTTVGYEEDKYPDANHGAGIWIPTFTPNKRGPVM